MLFDKVNEMTDYVALFERGRNDPLGALRQSYVDGVIQSLKEAFPGTEFYTKPINQEEAGNIREAITRCSPETEARFRKA